MAATPKRKSEDYTTACSPRGVRVNHPDGSRDFLRADSVPAARRALKEGKTDPWVPAAVAAWDAYVVAAGGEPW